MRMIPFNPKQRFYPPFKNDLVGIYTWLKPMTVIVRGESYTVGGVMLSSNILATTAALEDDNVVVQLLDGKKINGRRIDHVREECFLSFYVIPNYIEWVGLPAWAGEDMDEESMFFSYIPARRERIVMWKPIKTEDSCSAQTTLRTKKTPIEIVHFEHTFPVVDEYGYFVGLGIGTSEEECLVQNFSIKTCKL